VTDVPATVIGAIDQGTTGTRVMLFDRDGAVVASAYDTHEQHHPEPNWVEHDPVEIWETTKDLVTDVLEDAGCSPSELAALGVTNQRETILAWDAETGRPVHDALVWQDRRTTDRVEELKAAGKTDWLREKTGLEPDPYFSAPKLEWILDNATDEWRSADRGSPRERAARGEVLAGTIDSWLIYNLTGEHVTDVTNASRTLLYNIHDLEWDEDLLEEFDVPASMLPEVRPSSDEDYYGTTDPGGFLGAEVPVAGALGDQQAAMFGQACFEEGEAKCTYGAGSFYLMNTGEEAVESEHGLLTTIGFQLSGEPVQYALEGATFISGGAIEWLDDVGFVDHLVRTAKQAKAVDSAEGVYLVPAFAGLGTPQWDPRARGTIVGITRGTRREHIVRATTESIGYQTRDMLEATAADAGIKPNRLRVDGGAVKNNFLCQLQADLTQTGIVRPEVDETTALGVAYAAGLAVGFWDHTEELRSHWELDSRFQPEMDADEADRRYECWTAAVDRSLDWNHDS
jgi:glycerol kinase